MSHLYAMPPDAVAKDRCQKHNRPRINGFCHDCELSVPYVSSCCGDWVCMESGDGWVGWSCSNCGLACDCIRVGDDLINEVKFS